MLRHAAFKILSFLFIVGTIYAGEPVNCLSSAKGGLKVSAGDSDIFELRPSAFDAKWKLYHAKEAETADSFKLAIGERAVKGAFSVNNKNKAIDATWTFLSENELKNDSLGLRADLDTRAFRNGKWKTDSKEGVFPENLPSDPNFFRDETKSFSLIFPDGKVLKFDFAELTRISFVDIRAWGVSSYGLCIQKADPNLKSNETATLKMTISYADGITCSKDSQVQIRADENWIPLKNELDILAGSALDLSKAGFLEGPCGSKGKVIVGKDGHFVFEKEADVPLRFYGVNLCFEAQYLPKEKADQLLDRLTRLGYNAIRIHHHDCMLTDWQPGFNWNETRVNQLDYLIAEASKRGIYLTTDLFVTRVVSGQQIGLKDQTISIEKFKALIPVYEPAYQDWAKFAGKFLNHVNPYTGRRLADEPALAWISLVNENSASSYSGVWDSILKVPEWKAAWNAYLAERYPDRKSLENFLGNLSAEENPSAGTVNLPSVIWEDSKRARAAQIFAAELERKSFRRMRDFLRNEIKCQALLTDMNDSGSNCLPLQSPRKDFDYIDEHFYVDHPQFLGNGWDLPSRSPNANPIRSGGSGAFRSICARLYGKPFTVSEYSYAAPGPYRGIGSVLTAATASLNNWDAFWRFNYSSCFNKNDSSEFTPSPISYFDLARDPLSQASDRLALLIFLRRDLKPASHQLALLLPENSLKNSSIRTSFEGFKPFIWTSAVCGVIPDENTKLAQNLIGIPYEEGLNSSAVMTALRNAKIPYSDQIMSSESGEISLDSSKGIFTIDSPRSAGGYASAGKSINAANAGVQISELSTGATIMANSLDKSPIRSAARILVSHLTDLQNTNCLFGEASRQTLLKWGELPYLVRDGSAKLKIKLENPGSYSVWAISTGGRRIEKIPVKAEDGGISFTVNVRGSEGARMLYEISR